MKKAAGAEAAADTPERWASIVVIGSTMLGVVLILLHVPHVNGLFEWKWPWRRLAPVRLYVSLGLAMLPFFVAQLGFHRRRWTLPVSLAVIATTALLLQFVAAGLQQEPFGLSRVQDVVAHPYATSYYWDAMALRERRHLLADYPQLVEGLHVHSTTKPPGPVLSYVLLTRLLGADSNVPFAAGVLIGILAALAVPAVFFLSRSLGADRDAAFQGASLVALSPALLLFFPQLDQVHALVTCLMVGLWVRALRRDSMWASAGVGALLCFALFYSHALLVLGAILATLAVASIVDHRRTLAAVTRHASIVWGMAILFHAILWYVWGYDPIATFRAIYSHQARWMEGLHRSYWQGLLGDPLDFAIFGAGWVIALLAMLRMVHGWVRKNDRGPTFWLEAACLAQIALLPALGLARSESARLWIFLLPLLAFPAGMELSRWTIRRRLLAYLCLGSMTAVICQNVTFLDIS